MGLELSAERCEELVAWEAHASESHFWGFFPNFPCSVDFLNAKSCKQSKKKREKDEDKTTPEIRNKVGPGERIK